MYCGDVYVITSDSAHYTGAAGQSRDHLRFNIIVAISGKKTGNVCVKNIYDTVN